MGYKNKLIQQEYQRQWIANRRESHFKNKICVCCGDRSNLELSHKDRTTKIDHKVWSWSEIRRNTELAKCEPMCHECHRIKTTEERQAKAAHGISSMYKLGCRCAQCRAWNKARRRRQR